MTNLDPTKSVGDFASSTCYLEMNAQELLMECMKDELTFYSNRHESYITYFFCWLDPDASSCFISDVDINAFQKKVLEASTQYLSMLQSPTTLRRSMCEGTLSGEGGSKE